MTFLTNAPEWVQQLLTWITTGSGLAAICGVIGIIFQNKNSNKNQKGINQVQNALLQKIVDGLSVVKDALNQAQNISSVLDDAVAKLSAFTAAQEESNKKLAQFVMECFNRSNLSKEKKAELQLLADELFYSNSKELIATLEHAKADADAVVADYATKIAELEKQLEEEKAKCAIAQENIKSNRRV